MGSAARAEPARSAAASSSVHSAARARAGSCRMANSASMPRSAGPDGAVDAEVDSRRPVARAARGSARARRGHCMVDRAGKPTNPGRHNRLDLSQARGATNKARDVARSPGGRIRQGRAVPRSRGGPELAVLARGGHRGARAGAATLPHGLSGDRPVWAQPVSLAAHPCRRHAKFAHVAATAMCASQHPRAAAQPAAGARRPVESCRFARWPVGRGDKRERTGAIGPAGDRGRGARADDERQDGLRSRRGGGGVERSGRRAGMERGLHPVARAGPRARRRGLRPPRSACLCAALIVSLCGGCRSPARRRPEPLGVSGTDRPLVEAASRLVPARLAGLTLDFRDGLSPDEVALLAVAHNPELRERRAARGVAEAQVLAAGVLPNPTLALGVDVPLAGGRRDTVLGHGVSLRGSLDALVRRSARRRAARGKLRSVLLDVAWQEWQVALRAQRSACRVLLLRRARAIAQQHVDGLRAVLDRLREASRQRAVTAARLLAVTAAHDRARARRAGIERRLHVEEAELAALLGMDLTAVQAVRGALPPLPDPSRVSAGRLLAGLGQRRFDLRAIRRAIEAQDAAWDAAVLRAFPAIELGVSAGRDTDGVWTVGPVVQLGLPVLDRGQADRRAVQAVRQQLVERYAARRNEARRQVRTALAALRGAQARLGILREAIGSQQRLVDAYRAGLERGLTDAVLAYQARTSWVELRLQEVDEQIAAYDAWTALRAAAGFYRLPREKTAARDAAAPGAAASAKGDATPRPQPAAGAARQEGGRR
ncbi:MAG: TolC family protein [Planctomycetota bacterium]|nr:MAG: TolC family protein [Planctomycetota bacterium]